jgi:3-oxoacyl-[acyl-carrier protein] reductase
LGITFTTVLPQFAPETGVGRPTVQAYAGRAGLSVENFLHERPFALHTPEIAGDSLVELARATAADTASAYLLSGDGLKECRDQA